MSGSPLHKIKSVFSRHSSEKLAPTLNNNDLTTEEYNNEFEEPPLSPLNLKGYKATTKHRVLTAQLGEEIRQHIPSLLQINHDWKLLYSIDQSGTSLQTLYTNCKPKIGENLNRRRGYILVIQDSHKNIFGAYLNDNLRPLDGKYYYGNGDCFLWKAEKSKIKKLYSTESNESIQSEKGHSYEEEDELNLKVYPYTSLNDFIIYSNNDFISVGSGDGKFGLWVDSNLEYGASDSVETFGNEPLSSTKKFRILALEIWKVV